MTEIWAAVATPMTSEGQLALELVPAQRAHLEGSSIDGAFVSGTTGEFASLTSHERHALIDAWAEAGAGFRLAAHVGSTTAADAEALAAHAAERGYEMVAAVPPFYGSAPGLDRIVDHLASTAAAAPELDFCYYHIPAFTGLDHRIDDIVEALVERVPNFVALKFTSPDLVAFARIREAHPHVRAYFGQDELMPAALALGAEGFIGSLYNAVGPIARRTADLFAAGDVAGAREQHAIIRNIAAVAGANGGLGFIKTLVGLIGPATGPARAPWGPPSAAELHAAEALADRIRAALGD